MVDFKLFKGTVMAKRLVATLFIVVGYFPISPVIAKLLGLHFSIVVITMFSIANTLTGTFQTLFRRIPMFKLLAILMISDVIVLCFLVCYYFNVVGDVVFVLIVNSIFILQVMLGGTLNISLDTHISRTYSNVYKDYLLGKDFVKSIGSTIVLSLTLVLSIWYPVTSNLILSFILILFAIYFQYGLYIELKSTYVVVKNDNEI